jgi:hypothetical protein
MMFLAALGGCVSTDRQQGAGFGGAYNNGMVNGPPAIPGVQGPWGQPVAMAAPYTSAMPSGEAAAREMMSRNVPIDLVQVCGTSLPGASCGVVQAGGMVTPPGGIVQAGGMIGPPGVPFQPVAPGMSAGAMAPGMSPSSIPPGAVAAVGAMTGGGASRFAGRRTEVRFVGPTGMKLSWFAPGGPGASGFAISSMTVPTRYNFNQAAIYRLKLSNIPQHPNLDLYPTLEVVPSNLVTDAFLAHSAVPIRFTDEDFDQVSAGNYIVKVIYLPSPQYQDQVVTGPDEVVSTRLEPGVDPIAEAHRRGNILLVVRMGNINLEAPNTPALDAPNPYGNGHGGGMPHAMTPPGQLPGGMNGRPMAPNGAPMNAPTVLPPATNGEPVSQLPDASTLQQAQYHGQAPASVTAAKLAGEMTPGSAQPASSFSQGHWWSTSGDR